jgi:hypothetical protein
MLSGWSGVLYPLSHARATCSVIARDRRRALAATHSTALMGAPHAAERDAAEAFGATGSRFLGSRSAGSRGSVERVGRRTGARRLIEHDMGAQTSSVEGEAQASEVWTVDARSDSNQHEKQLVSIYAPLRPSPRAPMPPRGPDCWA